MLETFIEHSRAEGVGDVDGTMATLVDDPEYHFWSPGMHLELRGRSEVRDFYAKLFDNGGIGNSVGRYGRFIIADNEIFFEVAVTRIQPWRQTKEAGFDIGDESGHYAVRSRCAVVLSFDNSGLMRGETSYSWVDPINFERVPDAHLSDGYRMWLERFALAT